MGRGKWRPRSRIEGYGWEKKIRRGGRPGRRIDAGLGVVAASLLAVYAVMGRQISRLDRRRCARFHEPPCAKAFNEPAGSATDDEVGQDGAHHGNELKAVA
jgi:hypothetical protein